MVNGYVIQGIDTQRYKVGITLRMRSRYSAYRAHSPEELRVVFLAVFDGTQEAEKWEQATLKRYRPGALHGEWLKSDCGIGVEVESGRVGGARCVEIPTFSIREGDAKTHIIGVRVDEERHGQFERAAKREGKAVSDWLRGLGVAAIAPPPEPVRVPASAPRLGEHQVTHSVPRESPHGLTAQPPHPLRPSEPPPLFWPGETQPKSSKLGQKPGKRWIDELKRLRDQAEVDPEEASREEARLLVGFVRPKGWLKLTLEEQAEYLDQNRPLGAA